MGCGILRRWGGWRLRRSDAFGKRAQCRGLDAPTGAIGAHVFVSRSAGIGLPWTMEIGRPKTQQRWPEVLTVSEELRTLSLMHGACDVGQTALRHGDDALLARMEAMEA